MSDTTEVEIRRSVVKTMLGYALANPDSYEAHMSASSITWLLRERDLDLPTRIRTMAVSHGNLVALISSLGNQTSPALMYCHTMLHQLAEVLNDQVVEAQKLEDDFLTTYADDFAVWAAELSSETEND